MFESDAAFLVHRTDANSVLLFAIMAAPKVSLIALTRLRVRHFVNVNGAALDTAGSVSPAQRFKELYSLEFIRTGRWNLPNHRRLAEIVSVLLECHR